MSTNGRRGMLGRLLVLGKALGRGSKGGLILLDENEIAVTARGSLVQRELSAKLTEGLFCVDYRFLQSFRHGKPCHLPLHKGGLGLVPLKRVCVIIAWMAGQ